MTKQFITATVAAFFVVATVLGIPAKRVTLSVTQPDGTQITITHTGDEFLHYSVTIDAMPVVRNETGAYCYANVVGDRLEPYAMTAHNPADRSDAERAWVATHRTAIYADVAKLHREKRAPRSLNVGVPTKPMVSRVSVGEEPRPTFLQGRRRGLIILAEFSDVKMKVANPKETWSEWANQIGYRGHQNAGSLRDYFLSQSFGQFDLEFDVVGPYTLPHIEKYYGAGNDDNVPEMIADLCRMADDDVDFSLYDWDDNGEVEQVFVVYAGYSEAEHAPDWTIWPHAFWLSACFDSPIVFDGVAINRYACSNELKGTTGSVMAGIGTAAHEFSHCLGLPDFYATDYGTSQFCMGMFSLMDYGCYNNSGFRPMPYTAYERWFCGWMKPIELAAPTAVTGMKSLEDGGEAYVVYNPGQRSEYYLIQNMQNSQFAGPETLNGLLICHVDYDYNAWINNAPNNEDGHPRMTYFSPATQSYSNLNAQLFSQNTLSCLTDNSLPAAFLYNANTDGEKLMHRPITQISTANGEANFLFCKTIAPIEKLEPRAQTSSSYKAMWNYHPQATSYNLRYGSVREISSADRLLFVETMDGLKSENPSSTNIAAKLNNYLETKDWSGMLIYQHQNGAKVGSSRQNGNLTSPLQTMPSEKQVTVLARFAPNSANGNTRVNVSLLAESGKTIASAQVDVQQDDLYALSFDGVTEDFKVSFTPEGIAIISDVRFYNGKFTANEIESGSAITEYYDTKTVEGITDTWYKIEGLTVPQQYFEVQVVVGPFHSEWSAVKSFTLNPDGIASVETDNAAAGMVDVYTAAGVYVGRRRAEHATDALPAGVYLIRNANGSARSVLVR